MLRTVPSAETIEGAVDATRAIQSRLVEMEKTFVAKELHVSNADPTHSLDFAEGYYLGLRVAAFVLKSGGAL